MSISFERRIKNEIRKNSVEDRKQKISSDSDLEKMDESQSIVNSVINILKIRLGSYMFNCGVGSELYKYIFARMDRLSAMNIQNEIIGRINAQEKRVSVGGVSISPTKNGRGFYITFFISLPDGVRVNIEGHFSAESQHLWEKRR